jgi:hypothetical protein
LEYAGQEAIGQIKGIDPMTKVADRSAEVSAMVEAAETGRALMGGTKAMRQAGEKFLPKFEKETNKAYDARKKSSWLFNGYRKTVRDMTGRVFDKSIELGSDMGSTFDDWVSNIDLQGRDLSQFAREVFSDGMSGSGISYVMVDAPRREGDVSKAQAQAQNLRPYMSHLKVEQVLGWRTYVKDNVTKLAQFRIMESVTAPDPKDEFADIEIEQVRVLEVNESGLVNVRLFQREGKEDKWVEVDQYPTDLTEIMVMPFYANRKAFFTGEPVLDDLADVNVAHWQSQSDQRNILHVARVPILHGKGFGEKEDITIGSNQAVMSEDPNSDLKWVEHTGKAIDAGRQDLKDLEFQMETHGLQLLVQKGNQSATGEALDAAKETSQLSMMADALKDCLEQALAWMAEIANETLPADGATVTVNKDFGVSMVTPQLFTALLGAVNTGNLSRETFLTILRDGRIPDDLNIDLEMGRIEADDEASLEGDLNGVG